MNELIKVKLELIAAKAKSLSIQYSEGKLWEGELQRGIGELRKEILDLEQRAEKR
jgi:hypothetical protein